MKRSISYTLLEIPIPQFYVLNLFPPFASCNNNHEIIKKMEIQETIFINTAGFLRNWSWIQCTAPVLRSTRVSPPVLLLVFLVFSSHLLFFSPWLCDSIPFLSVALSLRQAMASQEFSSRALRKLRRLKESLWEGEDSGLGKSGKDRER